MAGKRPICISISEELFLELDERHEKEKFVELVRKSLARDLYIRDDRTGETFAARILPDVSAQVHLYFPIRAESKSEERRLYRIICSHWDVHAPGDFDAKIAYASRGGMRRPVYKKLSLPVRDVLENFSLASFGDFCEAEGYKLVCAEEEGKLVALDDGENLHVSCVDELDDTVRTCVLPRTFPVAEVLEKAGKMCEEIILMHVLCGQEYGEEEVRKTEKVRHGDLDIVLSAGIGRRGKLPQGERKFFWRRRVEKGEKIFLVRCGMTWRKIPEEE